MGVQTEITLEEVQKLFRDKDIKTLTPTRYGVMDTTYILDNFVLKKYERDMGDKISQDIKLLDRLRANSLNTTKFIKSADEWYLYERLNGLTPISVKYFHIQALARFLAKFHKITYKQNCSSRFVQNYDIAKILRYTKENFYLYYKKLQELEKFKMRDDGFIHGDIFKDNTLFDGQKVAVFDFIDGGCGEFAFDIAVSLISFNPYQKSSLNRVFLNTYNQHAPKKIKVKELKQHLKKASKLYALLRIDKYKSSLYSKELLKIVSKIKY